MGTNRWDFDADPHLLVVRALEFADMVKEEGIAELHGAWIAEDEKLMWCTWDTDDVAALRAAFDEMNRQSGLTSELTEVKTFYSTTQEPDRVAIIEEWESEEALAEHLTSDWLQQ